jgi:hypothetical protein
MKCPKCASKSVVRAGWARRKNFKPAQRFRCNICRARFFKPAEHKFQPGPLPTKRCLVTGLPFKIRIEVPVKMYDGLQQGQPGIWLRFEEILRNREDRLFPNNRDARIEDLFRLPLSRLGKIQPYLINPDFPEICVIVAAKSGPRSQEKYSQSPFVN